MSNASRTGLLASGALLVVGALLHIATIFGGPAWYAFLGAPAGLVAMAESGSLRPAISCVVIAAILLICAAYAFSGAGVIRRLPAARAVLAVVGLGLLIRGLMFPPLVAWQPALLIGICGRCQSVNMFVIVTSALCLLVGAGLIIGVMRMPATKAGG